MSERIHSRDNEIVVREHPRSPVAEAYRSLRTNLNFISPDKPLKSIIITSCEAGAGKSMTTANLAVSMANNGQKVILIDADMRKPMVHRFFELANYEGLSNVLTGEIDFEEGIKETDVEGLQLLTSGILPPNPAELLGSRKMEAIIKKAAELADIVLIDTPPVVLVTDPVILGNKVDGVIIVVDSHNTQNEMLVKAKEQLDRTQANILGAVLNRYPAQKGSSYYYKYSYYYNSYQS